MYWHAPGVPTGTLSTSGTVSTLTTVRAIADAFAPTIGRPEFRAMYTWNYAKRGCGITHMLAQIALNQLLL